ncbi:MAG: immunity protein Tsi6 family protein [Janthinobacterium lividum]
MTRIEIFQQALDGCRKIGQQFPDNPLLKSAQIQMQYLIDLESGKRQDRERLSEINIGLIAVREIEGVDDDLANWIYERVCPAVEEMKREG